MTSKLAIFDIDGTLTDSVQLHQKAFVNALQQFGLVDFDTNWSNYTHHTDSYIFKTIFEAQFNTPLTHDDLDRFEELLTAEVTAALQQTPLTEIEGAKYFIQTLVEHSDYDVVFATGSLFRPASLKLQEVGIALPGNLLVAANKLFSREDLVLHAIAIAKKHYSRSDYAQIISFGDGYWDYDTARHLNLDFIGIHNIKLQAYDIAFFSNYVDNPLLSSLRKHHSVVDSPDFRIKPLGKISAAFRRQGLFSFHQAANFIQNLRYGRNENKNDLLSLFADKCGTCSTKHALLQALALENDCTELVLLCGLFRMNGENTPEVATTLRKHGLDYLPEAHNYLKYKGQILDYTKASDKAIDFRNDLIEEIEIHPDQITDFKVQYHQGYLQKWLLDQPNLDLSFEALWAIREQCILDLAAV